MPQTMEERVRTLELDNAVTKSEMRIIKWMAGAAAGTGLTVVATIVVSILIQVYHL